MHYMANLRFGSIVVVFLLASVVSAGLLLAQPRAACAADLQIPCGFGQLTGRVTAADTGLGLANVAILVASTSAADYANGTTTDASGNYAINIPVALVGNDFNVSASEGKTYLRSPGVTAVEIFSGTVTTQNFVLARGATIRGVVESAKNSLPVTETVVTAMQKVSDFGPYQNIKSTAVDATGTYTLTGLDDGAYVLYYQPTGVNQNYSARYSGDVYRLADAEAISVTKPVVVQADIELSVGAVVQGRIQRADTLLPAGGVIVGLRNLQDAALSGNAGSIATDSLADGSYTFVGVPPGVYIVSARPYDTFSFPDTKDLLGAYYGNTRKLDEAESVTVLEANLDDPSNPVADIDILLAVGATFTGTVVDAATDLPVAGVSVYISQTIEEDLLNFAGTFFSDSNGIYTATGLLDLPVQVGFVPPTGYLPQAYDGIDHLPTQSWTEVGGEVIALTLGMTVTNINAELNQASTIAGRVVDTEGNPLEDVYIRVQVVDNPELFVETFTNSNGEYLRYVLPGEYQVRFSRNVICGCYNNEYFTTGEDPSVPTPITVGALAEVENINATLACGSTPPLETPQDMLFMPRLARPE